MTDQPNIPEKELVKLKTYLASMVLTELENQHVRADKRRQVVMESTFKHYQNLKINLPPAVRDQVFK